MKINVVKLTIKKAASLMEQHAFSSYDLTKECLHRIEAMNQKGPALQAVLKSIQAHWMLPERLIRSVRKELSEACFTVFHYC